MALSHLISRGHREITIFTSIHNIDVTEEIRAGARALFADRGLEYWPSRFLNIARAVEEGNEAAQAAVDAHFARHPGLTAVAAARDVGDGARRREPAQARAGLPAGRLARGDRRALRDGGEPSRPDAGGSRRAPAGRRGRPGAAQ